MTSRVRSELLAISSTCKGDLSGRSARNGDSAPGRGKERRFGFAEPKHVPEVADEQSQRYYIKLCNKIINGLRPKESIVFADAMYPEYRSQAGARLVPERLQADPKSDDRMKAARHLRSLQS